MQERIAIERPFRAGRIVYTVQTDFRERIPEKGPEPVYAAGYVRVSAEQHRNSADNQRAAIRRYAQNRNFRIPLIRSEQSQLQSR